MRQYRERGCGVGRGAVNIGSLDKESGEIIQLARMLNELALALLEIVAHNTAACGAKTLFRRRSKEEDHP